MATFENTTLYVFTFIYRVNGIVKTETEEVPCWSWSDASDKFHKELRKRGITGAGISSCYFKEAGGQAASAFGGANITV